MAAIAAVLTLPFLFAAAVQALIRSDAGLLVRAAFGYLPLAMLAIAIATPLTMLVLAATDELCVFISAAADNESAHFLAQAAAVLAVAGLSGVGPGRRSSPSWSACSSSAPRSCCGSSC